MYMDKQRAKKRKWRISERNLWVVSFCFGAIGTTVGMIIFRHKSKHPAFSLGLPILAAIQVFITFQMFY